jgi:endonuclease III
VAISFHEAMDGLRRRYGQPKGRKTKDPFELVLWENVAYLASPERREPAFRELKATVGLKPAAILAARRKDLERVTAHGILKETFAAKLRECARIAIEECGGSLKKALKNAPPGERRKILRRFPGIGLPGAEKILLFAGYEAVLAPESNGPVRPALPAVIRRMTGLDRHERAATSRGRDAVHLDCGLDGGPIIG